MTTLVIVPAASWRQRLLWDSYRSLDAGVSHDVLVAYRDSSMVPDVTNLYGDVLLVKKEVDGRDIPHKAFGAYRYYANEFLSSYDNFVFLSDDVILRRDNWLAHLVEPLSKPRLGWTATQVLSSQSRLFPNHLRAPLWAASAEALSAIAWEFDSDHGGELAIADQMLKAGFYGVQVGNKINLGYDSLEKGAYFRGDSVYAICERELFPDKHLILPYSEHEILKLQLLAQSVAKGDVAQELRLVSPFKHLGKFHAFRDLDMLDGSVYRPAVGLARKSIELVFTGRGAAVLAEKWKAPN